MKYYLNGLFYIAVIAGWAYIYLQIIKWQREDGYAEGYSDASLRYAPDAAELKRFLREFANESQRIREEEIHREPERLP